MKHILLLPAVLVIACGRTHDAAPLAREKFEAIYIELLDSSATGETVHGDSSLTPVAQRILARHSSTADEFRATVAKLNTDSRQWEEFYASVAQKIRTRDSIAAAQRDSLKQPDP